MKIKARHDYWLSGTIPEMVRVTGFKNVRIGIRETEQDEKWCKIRFAGDKKATMLAHPSRLFEEQKKAYL